MNTSLCVLNDKYLYYETDPQEKTVAFSCI